MPTIDPLGTNKNHLSCHIAPTHVAAILEAFLQCQGVKDSSAPQYTHKAVFVKKETSPSFSSIKWLVIKVFGLFQSYILLTIAVFKEIFHTK